ncbi:MAG: succinate dehydrogenase cytochrome b subunit [Planctomycetes bacterium]|nr:succinate dehydrogenase cytochrome b subunit [Planctomycetota bacterium]
MNWFLRTIVSSIGKKVIVAVSGLLLCGFLITHLLGNLFLYFGQEAFDGYARLLRSSSLLLPAEIFLATLFLVHIATALRVTFENLGSRPLKYQVKGSRGAQTVFSTTMVVTGLATATFTIIHLINFRLEFQPSGGGSLYELVVRSFRESFFLTLIYVVAIIMLGFHLSHGFQSAIRTLGVRHPRFDAFVNWIGYAFAALITAGFCSFPLYIHFFLGEAP